MMEVSVIIPSYNSDKTIFNCVQSITNQDYNGEYEIIVADSSSDDTQSIVKENFPKVILLTFDEKTDPGTARNTGVRLSKGKYILFIDSDCTAEANWINKILSIYKKYDYDAVGGCVIPANFENDHVGWAGYISEFREFIPAHSAGLRNHLPTCNLSYKKNKFLENGYFKPYYYPQEDLYYNHQFSKKGYRIYFDPDLVIHHLHRSDFIPYFKHQINIGYVTSSLLKITNLEGSGFVKNKLLALLVLPILPMIKFIRTILLFIKLDSKIIFKHPNSVLIFAAGLFPWWVGFCKGVFKPKFREVE